MIGKIYNIGDFQIELKPDSNGFTFRGDTECQHRNLTYSETGQIVSCKDCKQQVTAWWAFLNLMKQYQRVRDGIEAQRKQLIAEQERNLTHKAAIKVEDVWRRRKLVPTCPHCAKPILPSDGFGGSAVGKHYAETAKPMEFRTALEVVAGWKADEGEETA
jgi:ribosomal protein S27E